MQYSEENNGDVVIATIAGEVDLQTSSTLRKELMNQAGKSPLVIDLCQVSYMDSSGVASLVEALQASKKNQKPLVLAALGGDALRVLQLARLDQVFTLADTVEDAVNIATHG